MGARRKILTVFGTRPEAIKVFPLIHALSGDRRFVSRTCVTAQHRNLLDDVLHVTGIVPDHDLDLMTMDQSLDQLVARLLTGVGAVLDEERPAMVIVQGDTATAFAAALAAYHRKIPVIHVEAGLRSGDSYHPWPEEGNRKMIAALAAIHCAPTIDAADTLIAENVARDTVHVTGNTGIDGLQWMRAKLSREPRLASRSAQWRDRFGNRRIIALTSHRRENLGDGMANIADAVRQIASRGDIGIVFPMHPNPQVSEPMRAALSNSPNVALVEPLDYPHFVALLDLCALVLTDSGGVQEEAPALGKPVLVLRETTERPEGVAAGTARLVGTDPALIVEETNRLLDCTKSYAAMARAHSPYGDGKATERIVELLARG